MTDATTITLNGRTLAEILAMPASSALLYLESAKGDIVTLQCAYNHEMAVKCRYPVYTPLKAWIAACRKLPCEQCGKPMIYLDCKDYRGWACMDTALCTFKLPVP